MQGFSRSTALRICASLLFLGWLSACAPSVTSEVTRFHRLIPAQGETVAIVPLDEAKTGSLEFARYATMVRAELERLGYTVITTGEPDIFARLDYSVGPPETKIQSRPNNYVHYHFYYGRHYPYYFGTYWDEPMVYAYTLYPRKLDLHMERAGGLSVFEGHVVSFGRESNMNLVMDYLVTAMFTNFPGESGVTKVVSIRRGADRDQY